MTTTPTTAAWWLTPAAPAAIAVVRLPPLPALADRPWPAVGQARFLRVLDASGAAVDEAVAVRLAADVVEVMVHGGPGVRAAVMRALASHGLHDQPGSAPHLGDRWTALASAAHPAAARLLMQDRPLTAAQRTFADRVPMVLITGPANAGKSTLLNAWCGHRRALVSAMPGTTRDLVAAATQVRGWRLRLVDSAGLRATEDALESAGQALVAQARRQADLVIALHPPGTPPEAAEPGDLVVSGKADLNQSCTATVLSWSNHGLPDRPVAQLLERLGDAVLERLGLLEHPAQ